MNEKRMDMVLEETWGDEGGVGVEETEVEESTQAVAAPDTQKAETEEPAEAAAAPEEEKAATVTPEMLKVPKGVPGKEHPLLTRARQNARQQDMERFFNSYPNVKIASIPREVWGQVAKGMPLVSAYAMHENQQLKLQLAAERQDRANRARTPGGLGRNIGAELDELDRMWNEDD